MAIGTGLPRLRAACALVFAAGALLVGAAPALADTTINVNTTSTSSPSGDGHCSLPEAVDWANGGSDPDCAAGTASGTTTINVPAGKYVVTSTLMISSTTNIVGAGASTTDIDGGGAVQVMYVWPAGTSTVSGVEISGGESGTVSCATICTTKEPGRDGGGIYNDGAMTLRDDLISGNATGPGIAGLQFCLFASCPGNDGGNGGSGGGIYNAGTLTIASSTISNNTTGAGGAGNDGQTVGSSAGENGGEGGQGGGGAGIYSQAGTVSITNSTISGNATGAGGNGGGGSNATQTNTNGGNGGQGGGAGSGGGIEVVNGTATITGSTIDENRTGPGSTPGTPGAGLGTGSYGATPAAGHGGVGGGLDFAFPGAPTATLRDDTMTGNSTGAAAPGADSGYGGIAGAIGFYGTGSLTNVTIAGNSSSYGAGAIYLLPGSTLTESNSIIASNRAGLSGTDNCEGFPLTDGGHNIVYGVNTCPGTVADPKLQTLASNGGPTQTMRLGAGSPAIDTVPASACSITTDQRGVARPQGSGCDAGAYEVAPPGLTALTATASGSGSAAVNGQVTANLQDTLVTVRYGTSTAYGSTSTAIDMGSGSAAKPLAVTLSGLQPGTAYHAQVVATNADGTSTSGDLTLTTPTVPTPPAVATASVVKTKVTGDVLLVRVACAAGGAGCSGRLKLTSRITTLRGKVVAIKASAGARTKVRRRTTVRTVGSGSYTLAGGQATVVKITLNALGKRLLKLRHRLLARLTSSGTASLTSKVTFIYKPKRRK